MAAAALVLGTGIAAYSSMRQGDAQKEAYEMEAAAKRAQGAQVQIAADREVELTQRRMERTQNAQLVAFGRSGVLATSGSPLAQLEDTAANAMDEITAIRNAAKYRKGSLLTEAGLSEFLGGEAQTAGQLNAFSSILQGAGKNPYMYDSKTTSSGGSMTGAYTGDNGTKYRNLA